MQPVALSDGFHCSDLGTSAGKIDPTTAAVQAKALASMKSWLATWKPSKPVRIWLLVGGKTSESNCHIRISFISHLSLPHTPDTLWTTCNPLQRIDTPLVSWLSFLPSQRHYRNAFSCLELSSGCLSMGALAANRCYQLVLLFQLILWRLDTYIRHHGRVDGFGLHPPDGCPARVPPNRTAETNLELWDLDSLLMGHPPAVFSSWSRMDPRTLVDYPLPPESYTARIPFLSP